MPVRALTLALLCLSFSSGSLQAAGLALRHAGARPNGEQDWQVLLEPDAASAVAVEIGLQFAGGSIVSVQPNAAAFDNVNPGQNPFTGSVTSGVSIHNGGAAAFASLGGVVSSVAETVVMTVVTNSPGRLSLGGQDHNGYFTGARVWQGVAPVDGLTATLQIIGSESDFNLDGLVDGRDFLTWQRGFGISAGAGRADGDANADGKVDGVDLLIWRGQFGGPAVAVAIPEPSTISASLLLGALFFCPARRGR